VRTLTDNAAADRPMRRTALVANEVSRYNVKIASLTDTRLGGDEQLNETGAGHTFWSGRNSKER